MDTSQEARDQAFRGAIASAYSRGEQILLFINNELELQGREWIRTIGTDEEDSAFKALANSREIRFEVVDFVGDLTGMVDQARTQTGGILAETLEQAAKLSGEIDARYGDIKAETGVVSRLSATAMAKKENRRSTLVPRPVITNG